LSLMVNVRNLPVIFRRRIHKKVLVWIIKRIIQCAHHNTQNDAKRVVNYTRSPCLRVPYNVSVTQFVQLLREFNSRLCDRDKRVLTSTRVVSDCATNLLRVLSYK
jgi:hypothetical protein